MSIIYNYLNLPVDIVFSDDHKINYLYDASGRKLRMTITYADRTVETFNYCGGVIYHDQDLESIEFGVGRVVKKPDSHFYYQYYMTDHLGNIRQVYEYNESTQEVEVVQENHFYPYGLTMGGLNIYSGIESTHLYQGKELENKTRLNWYDFHARRFDSQLGRWHAIDPVVQFASPYVGMGNNPVIGVDPEGTSWEFHGHQHFQQGYVNGEKVGDPIPGEIDGYWYWNDYPTFTSSGNFTIHPGNSGHAGSGGNGGGQNFSDFYPNGSNWGSVETEDEKRAREEAEKKAHREQMKKFYLEEIQRYKDDPASAEFVTALIGYIDPDYAKHERDFCDAAKEPLQFFSTMMPNVAFYNGFCMLFTGNDMFGNQYNDLNGGVNISWSFISGCLEVNKYTFAISAFVYILFPPEDIPTEPKATEPTH